MGVVHLSTLDYFVLVLYLVATIALGLYFGKRVHDSFDLFLAGRRLPWWAIGMSIVVSDIGAIDIVGLAGSTYLYGMVLGNFDWIGSVPIMIVSGLVFVPIFWRARVYTIPEYLGKRYNSWVQSMEAIIWGVYLACFTGIMLFATSKMLAALLGWNITYSILISASIVGLYTMVGGLSAVVYTDTLQCVVMIAGCILVLVLGLIEVGGIQGMIDRVHALGPEFQDHFELVRPMDTSTPYPWAGILFGLALVQAPGYWISNQSVLQRAFGARTEFEVKAAMIWGAFLKTLIPVIIVVPGLVALAYDPSIGDSDLAILHLVSRILPSGLIGLFLAAFLAAFMSSVDSSLNSAATVWTNDLYKKFLRPNASFREHLLVGRIATAVCIVWAAGFAYWLTKTPTESIFTVFQIAMSLFLGPSLAILVLGMLWTRATSAGAIAGLVAGLVTSTGLFLVNAFASAPLFRIQDPFIYITLWACVSATVATVLISLMTTPASEEKLANLVHQFGRAHRDPDHV